MPEPLLRSIPRSRCAWWCLSRRAVRPISSRASWRSSALWHDNPLGGEDAPVPTGTYGGTLDQVGALVELELGGRREPP